MKLWFCFIQLFLLAPSFGNTVIQLATGDIPNPPFLMGSKMIDQKKPGITIEVLREIEKRLKIKFEIKRYPWKRAVHLIKNSNLDAVFHSSYKQERENFGLYPKRKDNLIDVIDDSRRIVNWSYYLYTLKDSPLKWNGNKFNRNHSQVVLGYTLGYAIDKRLNSLRVKKAVNILI